MSDRCCARCQDLGANLEYGRSLFKVSRIGTTYLDPETGEHVMPADFLGDEELRWSATSTTAGSASGATDRERLTPSPNCQDIYTKYHSTIPSANETTVESCPTCGTVLDIHYGPEIHSGCEEGRIGENARDGNSEHTEGRMSWLRRMLP